MQKNAKNNQIICKNIENNADYAEFLEILKSLSKNESIEDMKRHIDKALL